MKAQFASQAAGQWLGLRLQFIGVAMVTGICFIAVVQHQYDVADPGEFRMNSDLTAYPIQGVFKSTYFAAFELSREVAIFPYYLVCR